MRLLHLASPYMKGDDVKYAQKLLRDNKYGKYYTGAIDGEYGPMTAQAVYKAKYYLGYPKAKLNKVMGDILRGYLSGSRSLPAFYKVVRKRRLAALAAMPLRVKALNVAKTQIGYHEYGNNVTKYGAWFGWNASWCAMFVSWCYHTAGSTAFSPGDHYAGVAWLLADARAGRNGLSITSSPQPGDLAIFNWPGTGSYTDHVEFFVNWVSPGQFYAIGGNVSDSVGKRLRYRSNVYAFIRASR